jgi:hypothetical protein
MSRPGMGSPRVCPPGRGRTCLNRWSAAEGWRCESGVRVKACSPILAGAHGIDWLQRSPLAAPDCAGGVRARVSLSICRATATPAPTNCNASPAAEVAGARRRPASPMSTAETGSTVSTHHLAEDRLAHQLGQAQRQGGGEAVHHGSTLASRAWPVTFNPGGMDFRPCRPPAPLTRLVVDVNKPSGGSHASPRLPRPRAEGLGRST